jgi:hypothetical protein
MRTSTAIRFLFVAVSLAPRLVRADAASEARLRDALRSATAQVRTLEDEVSSGKAKEAQLQKELEAARAEAKQTKTVVVSRQSDREVADLRRRLADQEDANRKLIEAAVKLQTASRERAEAGQSCEEERAKLAPQVASCAERLARAEEKNDHLFQVGKEIIDWLGGVGVGAAIAAREPFLGLKRVQLENAAQDYEDKLYEQRLQTAGIPQPGSPPAAR